MSLVKRQLQLLWLIILFFNTNLSACKDHNSSRHGSINLRDKYSGAIAHFADNKDSLKLKALLFIIDNLADQYSYRGDWINRYNASLFRNKHNSLAQLIEKKDSVSQFYLSSVSKIPDTAIITNKFLIETVDNAFLSRNTCLSKSVNFNDFCEYVLPYKTGNESPEMWGTCLNTENYLCNDSLKDLKTIFEAAAYINNHLQWFKGTINYNYPIDIGFQMSKYIGAGSCYGQSMVALSELRAIGLPGVIDYVPSWGNRSDGHYWNAIILNNKAYPFDPTGPNIGFYKIEFKGVERMPYKISKVLRRTFSIQHNSLYALNSTSEPIPQIFNSMRIKDVTADYVPVSDIVLNYHSSIRRKFAYLYTFNDRTWVPSAWGVINDRQIKFKNAGRDIVYLPAIYINTNQFVPLGNPFILRSDGSIKELGTNEKKSQVLNLTRKYPDDETNRIKPGDQYELLFWNSNWKSLGITTATKNIVSFSNCPTGALFLLKDLTSGKQERIFTYENERQIWW